MQLCHIKIASRRNLYVSQDFMDEFMMEGQTLLIGTSHVPLASGDLQ